MNPVSDKQNYTIVIFVVAILGMLLVLFTTAKGVGASPDSVVYIGAARNVIAGKGLTEAFGAGQGKPLTRYPPLYPATLAVSGLGRADPLVTGRWLNALIFGGLILLAGGALFVTIPDRPWLAILGSLLTVTALPLINTHVMIWSESLFLLLGFSGLVALAAYLNRYRWWILVLSALLIGLALLTRYAAAPFVLTGAIGILLLTRQPIVRRILCLILFGIISTLPSALWAYRNLTLAGTATSRELAFHPIGGAQAWQAIFAVSGWLHIPVSAPNVVRIAIIFSVLALISLGVLIGIGRRSVEKEQPRTDQKEQRPELIWLLLIFVITYALFLVVSISFIDGNTPLDNRILSPLYVAGVILALYAIAALLRHAGAYGRILEVVIAASMIGFITLSALTDLSWIRSYQAGGMGFTSSAWQQSETIRHIEELPDDIPIFSNAPEAIYLLTGRGALSLPRRFLAVTQTANENYDAEVTAMGQRIKNEGGALVYFSSLGRRTSSSEEDLLRQMSLDTISQGNDGAIYAGSQQNR